MDSFPSPDDVIWNPVRHRILRKGVVGVAEPRLRAPRSDDMGGLRDGSQEDLQYSGVCKSIESRHGAIALRSGDMDSFATLVGLFRTRLVYVTSEHQPTQSDVKYHGEWEHDLELSLLSILN